MTDANRSIRRIVRGTRAVDGAGVHLVRVIGQNDVRDFDPFLMLDAFDSTDPADYIAGFPWHPHRGMETVTYLIEGEIEHGDSLGNGDSIKSGDCQWMTAGSGVIHQEMPQPAPRMLGAQLWLNLPAKDKMCDPSYGGIKREDIPVVRDGTATVRVVAGRLGETRGAFEGRHIPATYLDASIDAQGTWEYQSDPEATLFAYLVKGPASFDGGGEFIEDHQAVLFNSGRVLRAQAGADGTRFLLLEARPIREPIVWGGPIVTNTQEELVQAYRELESNTFIKHGQAR